MHTRSSFFLKSRSVFFAMSVFLLFSCRTEGDSDFCVPDRITVMTYNTQTFFDAIEDGTEFAEFIGPETMWTTARYEERLNRLRETVLLAGKKSGAGNGKGPDIVVLQEIETERVLRDLYNRLPSQCGYEHAVFVPPGKGNAFGSGILSRFPVENLSVHSVNSPDVPLRPLLEVHFQVGRIPLVVFAVHWKSRLGDNDTASLRLAQEDVLVRRIALLEAVNPNITFVACGDFNQNRDEFTLMNRYGNGWDWWRAQFVSGEDIGPDGSYLYDGKWETIDNIFWQDGNVFEFSSFQLISGEPLVAVDGVPFRYDVWSGNGYSDHLPLLLVLQKKNRTGV